jgi:hypothetical protein
VRELCDRHGSRAGLPYRVVMAAHPESDMGERADT